MNLHCIFRDDLAWPQNTKSVSPFRIRTLLRSLTASTVADLLLGIYRLWLRLIHKHRLKIYLW
jgi:hypothetical protein